MLAQDVVKSAVGALCKSLNGARLKPQGWDRIVGALREEVGEIDLKDTLAHVLKAIDDNTDTDTFGSRCRACTYPSTFTVRCCWGTPAGAVEAGEQLSLMDEQPFTLRISPPPLENSEARLAWDVRRGWERLHHQPSWASVEVVLLRNLAGVGVGLFAAEGFYPDFLLWLKRGDEQALAFVEPKGLRHQWPQDKFDLLEKIVPAWEFSVPVRGFVLSANSQAELQKIRPGFTWTCAPSVLLHQDAQGAYVERMLIALRALLPSCKVNLERLDAPGALSPS